jgi:Glycosyl hydrolases family 25
MTITMYDAADPAVIRNTIPGDAKAVAGYVGPPSSINRYVTFPDVVKRFGGKAHCFSIAVHDFLIAACLDIETGDATPAQAKGWFHLVKAHGQYRPCFYANASTMPAVKQALSGIPRNQYRLWIAAYPGSGANIPPGYDAHQYTDHGPHGENYDISVLRDDFFPSAPKPSPPPPHSPWQIGFNKGFNTGFNAGWKARH